MSDYMVTETSGRLAFRYRRTVVWIHWITAILVLMQIYIGFRFGDLPRGSEERAFVFGWHKTWGALILILALLRLAVRAINAPPPYPADFPKWERFFAVWSHRLFYVLLIALPLTGLAAVSGQAKDGLVPLQFGLSLPAIPGIPKENEIGEVHELLVVVTIALLVLHVLAALKHQFIDKGPIAGRMWPFRAAR